MLFLFALSVRPLHSKKFLTIKTRQNVFSLSYILYLVAPLFPAVALGAGEEFQLGKVWVHRLYRFVDLLRFAAVLAPFGQDRRGMELVGVAVVGVNDLGDAVGRGAKGFAALAEQAQFRVRFGVKTDAVKRALIFRVQLHPHEANRDELKTPCFKELYLLVQQRTGTPEIKDRIFCRQFLDGRAKLPDGVHRHQRVMPPRAAAKPGFVVGA